MSHRPCIKLVCAALGALGIMACGVGSDFGAPVPIAEVTPPSGAKVTATISAASLGDGPHQPSNLQLAFIAQPAPTSARVEIVAVTLVNEAGDHLDTLTPSKPQVWNGGSYAAWDERITPGGDLKASYELTTPSWGTLGGSPSQRGSTYGKMYKLRVTMRIDGVQIVLLESVALVRDAQATT